MLVNFLVCRTSICPCAFFESRSPTGEASLSARLARFAFSYRLKFRHGAVLFIHESREGVSCRYGGRLSKQNGNLDRKDKNQLEREDELTQIGVM